MWGCSYYLRVGSQLEHGPGVLFCSVLCGTAGSFSGYWIKGLDADKVDLRPDGEISLSLRMILARGLPVDLSLNLVLMDSP